MFPLALPWLSAALAAPVERVPLAAVPLGLPVLHDHAASRHQLTVKFRDETRARARQGGLVLTGESCGAAADLFAQEGLVVRPLVRLAEDRLAALEARAAERSGRAAPDLAGMLEVQTDREGGALLDLARRLQALPCVEYAHLAATLPPPPEDLSPTTPDYTDQQGYLGPDPGIGATLAHAEGVRGERVRLADCEYGWVLEHEDLVDLGIELEPGHSIHPETRANGWDEHGTAVLGQTSAVDNGYGVTGGAPDAEVGVYVEWSPEGGSRRVDAILSAVEASLPGDVVLLEMQAGGCDGAFGPAETNPNVFTATELAVDAGVVVVAAAGNGGADLDAGCYPETYGVWGDSGAILVGAGTADTRHASLSFSTHGERVDLQGWGTAVYTLGYGNPLGLADATLQSYTDSFGGTSSASPIVATAAVLVQDFVLARQDEPLDPWALRELLVETGHPPDSGLPVGAFPDVIAAFDALDGDRDGHLSEDWGGDDCDDAAAVAFPGNTEVWYDGIDGDCLGGDDSDADGDGAAAQVAGGDDCDDTDPAVGPHAEDIPGNGIDDDCDGGVDGIGLGDGGGSSPGKDGCSAGGGVAGWAGALLALGLVGGRRRRTG